MLRGCSIGSHWSTSRLLLRPLTSQKACQCRRHEHAAPQRFFLTSFTSMPMMQQASADHTALCQQKDNTPAQAAHRSLHSAHALCCSCLLGLLRSQARVGRRLKKAILEYVILVGSYVHRSERLATSAAVVQCGWWIFAFDRLLPRAELRRRAHEAGTTATYCANARMLGARMPPLCARNEPKMHVFRVKMGKFSSPAARMSRSQKSLSAGAPYGV